MNSSEKASIFNPPTRAIQFAPSRSWESGDSERVRIRRSLPTELISSALLPEGEGLSIAMPKVLAALNGYSRRDLLGSMRPR